MKADARTKRTQGALPLDPAIAGLQLEGLHALRSVGAVYMASPLKAYAIA